MLRRRHKRKRWRGRPPVEREGASCVPPISVERLSVRHALPMHLSRTAREQVRLDEVVYVAAEDGVNVAALQLRARVLDESVGREHVVAYLRAEGDVGLGCFERGGLGPALLKLQLVKARAKNLHRNGAVLVLRALVLARDDYSGRQMRDANSRVGRVDVLPARARRAIRVHAQVLLVDLDLYLLVNLRRDEERRERSLARARAERRGANEAVHARLRRQQAVCVLALDAERRALDAGLLSGL